MEFTIHCWWLRFLLVSARLFRCYCFRFFQTTQSKKTERTSRLIQRRATSLFEFGLPFPPWMAYTFGKKYMILSQFRSAGLVLMLCAIPAFAGSQYTRMVESKPVVENGLEFVASVDDEWVCYNPPLGRDPIQVQLFIRNVTDKPLIFSTFDTFGIEIKEQSGKYIHVGGGRAGTLRTKSVIIDP